MNYQNTANFAQQADEQDPLREFRNQFHIPQHKGKDCIYFTGNSLGLQPKNILAAIQQELNDWAKLGVEGHFEAKHPWVSYHELFPSLLAPIVGAEPEEIVAMNQLTVNLHLLMVSFYRPTAARYKIICEAKAFPSDQYALESQVRFHGFDPATAIIEVAPQPGEHVIRTEDIVQTIEQHADSTALVLFGGVNYYNGQVFDIPAITAAAHRAGALAGFDLAHAVGNVPLHLHHWNVDFACWCSYKYLNAGPGGVAGVYIQRKYITDRSIPRFAGWWGYDKATRFQMKPDFEPMPTAEGWQLSNAPILSMAAHKASLEVFAAAGMERLFAKGRLLSGYLHFVLAEINLQQGHTVLEVITPSEEKYRGCQVSLLALERGKEIFRALMEQGVIADWREPNVIRIAPVPLYNTFTDVWQFGQIIEQVLQKH